MFSLLVLFGLFIMSLLAIWLIIGNLGLFKHIGKFVKSFENITKDKSKEDK